MHSIKNARLDRGRQRIKRDWVAAIHSDHSPVTVFGDRPRIPGGPHEDQLLGLNTNRTKKQGTEADYYTYINWTFTNQNGKTQKWTNRINQEMCRQTIATFGDEEGMRKVQNFERQKEVYLANYQAITEEDGTTSYSEIIKKRRQSELD